MPLLVAFALACVGTFVGVMVAGYVLDPFLQNILGRSSWKLAGPYTGTYIGGSLNFFALWNGLEMGNPDLFAAANAVDNLTIFPLFLVWILVPDWWKRIFPVAEIWKKAGRETPEDAVEKSPARFRILDVVTLAFTALAVMFLSEWINNEFIKQYMPQFPTILIITTFALILAQFKFMKKLEGAHEMGNLSFYIFFAAVGAMMNIGKAIILSPMLFLYVTIIIIIHFVIIYGAGRLFRLDIRILTIASAAAKSGPPTVLALANVKGWKALALPGVALGLLGYAIGNYIGFAAAYLMKLLLGL